MTGFHHFQNSPASMRSAAPFEWADLPEPGNRGGRADAAAVLLLRFEALAAQIAELEALREHVLEAEQKIASSASAHVSRPRSEGSEVSLV
ncbi:hypothetical protein IVB15_10055 [Bradyrhizobium sp. 182]|uniref:hypothetical protein n=1 Tax=unclassified Bradyrhizobium TaxID=2631580 RepID=UPI001FF79B59|nr:MULTISPECIES: hypothetical protein [unclassified Bradyrhizobium]MCK1424057.1 hypothetical protein [Bradyrhizobium sp. CW12]MCK1528072.1 hypothetical protein [Bradyrhizobium sp. 182]MCK1647372.1 hypothetical protein [Bradyrhizobium sp. 154]